MSYVIIILFVVLFRTYIATPVMVSGSSMDPTLKDKEIMILNKMDKKYERFEIVVLKTEHGDIIKRVIGLPGETISIENSNIYINSRKIKDKYGSGKTSDVKKIKLGKDEYFVLGDNRGNSMDSRYYGPFKINKIKGSTGFIIFPFSKFGKVE
jgi:signal peptidase I